MRIVRPLVLAMALGLAACGEGSQDESALPAAAAPETGAAAQVARLSPELRNGVFERAIRASGAACPMVSSADRAEVRHGVKGWKAQCDNGTAHLLEISPDGTAQVTSRRD